MSRKVIVIGAGPGGLASAMLLAKSGCDVTVLERQDRVGGRTATIGDRGFHFDLGPTFFLYPRVLEEIFTACGRTLRNEVELRRLDPQYHLIFEDGGELRATGNLPKMQAEMARLSPHDASQLPRYMEDNRAKLAAFRPILESSFRSPLDLLRPNMLKAGRRAGLTRSVHDDLCRYFKDPRVRLAFSFQSKYLGMSPFRCPSLFTILSFLEYEYGVWHPVGGCGEITRAMARACREMGVHIRLNEPVEKMLFSGRTATGAQTSQGQYHADAVVINADFAAAMTQLVPDPLRKRWTDRRIAKKKFSCSTFMMYLGIEGKIPELEHHTIWLAKDYQENLKDIEDRHQLSANPSFYVQNACRTDSTLAPSGCSTLYCLAPVTHRTANVNWSQEAPRFRELLIRQMKKIGIKDIEQRIRYEKVITPDDWESKQNVYRGATFNLSHSLDQMLHRRPNNRFEDLENVYLVGGGTHPGSGLPVIFESARISSRALLEDHGMPVRWPGQTGEAARYARCTGPQAAQDARYSSRPMKACRRRHGESSVEHPGYAPCYRWSRDGHGAACGGRARGAAALGLYAAFHAPQSPAPITACGCEAWRGAVAAHPHLRPQRSRHSDFRSDSTGRCHSLP